MAESSRVRLQVIEHACSKKCMGHADNAGGCCKLGQRDYIIGPVDDAEALLERLTNHLGRRVARSEVLIDFEEGRRMFPERSVWQKPEHYPALRTAPQDPHPCGFHGEQQGCTIYGIRPNICRSYECGWLQDALAVLF